MPLPSPLREFCCHVDPETKVRRFDFDEWHAILCGIGDGLQPWLPEDRSHLNNRHYYIVARGATSFLATCILVRVIGGAHGLHRG